jgi:hypothetical protein
MSRFDAIRTQRQTKPEAPAAPPNTPQRSPGRQGKKAISGYFSAEASRDLHRLALELNVSLQALMGEAFDDLMRKYGHHPLGER